MNRRTLVALVVFGVVAVALIAAWRRRVLLDADWNEQFDVEEQVQMKGDFTRET